MTTEDGYILQMFHVTGHRGKAVASDKGPVLVLSGIATPIETLLGDFWSNHLDDDPWGLRLYGDGYDVYLG